MKKKIILIISMLMVLAMIFTGCNKPKTDEPKENTAQDNGEISEEDKKNDEYVELVKKTKGVSDLIEGDIIAQYVKIAKAEEEADKLTLTLSYTELAYIYEDHVFTNTAGMQMPLKPVSYTHLRAHETN